MTFAWARRVASGCLLLAVACKGGADAAPFAANDAGPDALFSFGIEFTFLQQFTCASGGLCAPPSQTVALGIRTSTDATVDVALEGGYGDAALSADQVTTVNGQATVSLQTSTMPTTFTVVARREGDASSIATLAVAIGASGFAVLQITPSYAGKRPNPAFLASVSQSTCAQVTVSAVSALSWAPAPVGATIVVPVPAEEHIAVDARIHEYATGCADIEPLAASVTRDVGINVFDVPMALGLTNMSATFTPDGSASASWQTAMSAAATRVGGGFFASTSNGKGLLDAMRAQVPPADQAQFDASRTKEGWDASADTWLSSRSPTIHDRASTWLAAAVGSPMGDLIVHLGAGTTSTTSVVIPTSFGPLSASVAGIPIPTPFTWTAAADDTVHLAGSVTLSSSPYIAHLADTLAAKDVPTATTLDVPGALASQLDCAGMATALVGATDAYGSCAASCVASLCGSALAVAWSSALASPAGGSDAVTLSLSVGTPGEVGDDAEPQYFKGSWFGEAAGPGVGASFPITGTVVGTEVAPPTP